MWLEVEKEMCTGQMPVFCDVGCATISGSTSPCGVWQLVGEEPLGDGSVGQRQNRS